MILTGPGNAPSGHSVTAGQLTFVGTPTETTPAQASNRAASGHCTSAATCMLGVQVRGALTRVSGNADANHHSRTLVSTRSVST